MYKPNDLLQELVTLLEDYREEEGHTYDVEVTRAAADNWTVEARVTVTNRDGDTRVLRLSVSDTR